MLNSTRTTYASQKVKKSHLKHIFDGKTKLYRIHNLTTYKDGIRSELKYIADGHHVGIKND